MKSVICLVVFLSCILLITAMTTKHHGIHTTHHNVHTTTHHPVVGSSVLFYYDAPSHYMVMKKDGYCYFMALTDAEQQAVHNPDGLRRIEIALMNMHTTSSHEALTGLDHAHISNYVYSHVCKNEHLIKLVQ